MSFLNTILKLRIFLWTLTGLLIIVFILMIIQYLSNLTIDNFINIFEQLFTIVLPFVIGYYYNIYKDQKSAIEELSKMVFELLIDAEEIESISYNKKFFEENGIFNSVQYIEAPYFKKEISMLYILGVHFNNIKWYEHKMYNLPINFKEQISTICRTYLEIDPLMAEYKHISIYDFMHKMYAPYHYTYNNTNNTLKEFFKLLISNYDGIYEIKFIEYLNNLNEVQIEEYYLNEKKYHT